MTCKSSGGTTIIRCTTWFRGVYSSTQRRKISRFSTLEKGRPLVPLAAAKGGSTIGKITAMAIHGAPAGELFGYFRDQRGCDNHPSGQILGSQGQYGAGRSE